MNAKDAIKKEISELQEQIDRLNAALNALNGTQKEALNQTTLRGYGTVTHIRNLVNERGPQTIQEIVSYVQEQGIQTTSTKVRAIIRNAPDIDFRNKKASLAEGVKVKPYRKKGEQP